MYIRDIPNTIATNNFKLVSKLKKNQNMLMKAGFEPIPLKYFVQLSIHQLDFIARQFDTQKSY